MNLRLFFLASLLGFLAGCAAPTQSLIPTPYPPEYLPTVIVLTANAANILPTMTSVIPTQTPSPTETPEATLTPTPLPTNTPTSIPGHDLAAVQFILPGPMSKVISPIQMRAMVISGETEKIQIDLYGEDGRLMSRNLRTLRSSTKGALISLKIPFETRAAAELGRITISTLDKSGRMQALNSVRVLLLSSGTNEINPPGNPSEPVGVVSPNKEEAVFGGVLTVKGDVWPLSLQPVVLELISPEGKSVGLRILTIEDINPQLFETTIPYKVTEPTLARLTIRQDDDRMPGLFYVYTQLVLLNP